MPRPVLPVSFSADIFPRSISTFPRTPAHRLWDRGCGVLATMSLQVKDLARVECRTQSRARCGYPDWTGRLWIDLFRWFWARGESERRRFPRHLALIRGSAPARPSIYVP